MKKILLLFIFLLTSWASEAQKVVLLKSFEESTGERLTFAEYNFYMTRDSLLEGYNLLSRHNFQSSKLGGRVYRSYFSHVRNQALYYTYDSVLTLFSTSSNSHIQLFASNVIDASGTYPGNGHNSLLMLNNRLYGTDGTKNGTTDLLDLTPYKYSEKDAIYTDSKDRFYFFVNGQEKCEIFETDGSEEGTNLMAEILSDNPDSLSRAFFIKDHDESIYIAVSYYDSTKFFNISDEDKNLKHVLSSPKSYRHSFNHSIVNSRVLTLSDGNLVVIEADSLRKIKEVGDGVFVGYYQQKALFRVFNGDVLYQTDGTSEGTSIIVSNYRSSAYPYNDLLYYMGTDLEHGPELWQYDGRETSLVIDLLKGPAGFTGFNFHEYNNILYFAARPQSDYSLLYLYKISEDASNILVSTFADYNQNGVKDTDEPEVPHQHYLVTPDSIHFHRTQAQANILLENSDYELSLMSQKGWDLSPGYGPISINLPADANKHYSFGVYPDSIFTSVETKFVGGIMRCSSNSTFTIHYKNTGTTNASGTISFFPDKRFNLRDTQPTAEGNFESALTWTIGPLIPQGTGTLIISVENPTFESMGDTLVSMIVSDFGSDISNHISRDTVTLSQLLTCSYDPNDIQVTPSGQGEKHLTLKKETLDYLIRFQNTGNDTAYQVVILDTLDTNLDLESLSIVGSSHSMITTLKDNLLKFNFEEIMLPDSTRDEPNSHGYILYTIASKSSLADSTVINNKADIFFDYNPPVTTNTVFNTLVDKLPDDTGKVLGIKSTARTPFTIYPNPASEEIKVKWTGKANVFSYQIYSSTGKYVLTTSSSNGGYDKIDTSMLNNGIYYLKVTSQDGVHTFRVAVVRE